MSKPAVALFDLDGTLVDSTYHHAVAWSRAFGRQDITVPVWRLHRAIGMGGDRLVSAVCGDDVETEQGDDIRAAWREEFDQLIDEVSVLDGARDLLVATHAHGLRVVIASSGAPEHVRHYLRLLDVDDLLAAVTDAEDVDSSKPAPDLLAVAIDKAGGGPAVCVGDASWDFAAAQRLGLPGVGVRTGGFSERELRDAGAGEVYDGPGDLLAAVRAGATVLIGGRDA